MTYTLKTLMWSGARCHVMEFGLDKYRLDVTLGNVRDSLEKMHNMKGEPTDEEYVLAKANGAFFDMSGDNGDIYSSFVDEGLYYHASAPFHPTLILWNDNKMTVDYDPDVSRHVAYQTNGQWAIGTGWSLIVDGKIDFHYDIETLVKIFGHPTQKHPRTMIGQKADGTIVIVVTDGRVNGSTGLNIYEQADLMLDLGCYVAVNMDGGGSSQLIVNDKTINTQQDNYARSIGTAFMVYGKKTDREEDESIPAPIGNCSVTASSLNVRTGPGIDYDYIRKVYRTHYMLIHAFEVDVNGEIWYRVTSDAVEDGWVHSLYVDATLYVVPTPEPEPEVPEVKPEEPTPPIEPEIPEEPEDTDIDILPKKMTTGDHCVYLRSGPSKEDAPIVTLVPNTVVLGCDLVGDYYRALFSNQYGYLVGYVNSDYLSLVEGEPL